ncbi:protein kinase shaggy-like [Schistocerca serialis cubense]|uniref:protein kinase shaggy-like n=1 Tax=Schistocerca serialis cubense TaxID=2023355 RepID=UPI00214EABAD|nr:protein kinase shaggy-like [Schistocerca serialis cubense]
MSNCCLPLTFAAVIALMLLSPAAARPEASSSQQPSAEPGADFAGGFMVAVGSGKEGAEKSFSAMAGGAEGAISAMQQGADAGINAASQASKAAADAFAAGGKAAVGVGKAMFEGGVGAAAEGASAMASAAEAASGRR